MSRRYLPASLKFIRVNRLTNVPLTSAFKPWAYTRTSKGVFGVLLNGALLLAVFFLGGGAKDTYHRNKKAFQTCYILAVLIKILLESRAGGGGGL